MNQTDAVAVLAAQIRGNYLAAKYDYGIDCQECDTSLKLVHTHFLLTHSSCLEDTSCLIIPSFARADVYALMNASYPASVDCEITITAASSTSCGAITITAL